MNRIAVELARALAKAEPSWTNLSEGGGQEWYGACMAVAGVLQRERLVEDASEFLRACHKHAYVQTNEQKGGQPC